MLHMKQAIFLRKDSFYYFSNSPLAFVVQVAEQRVRVDYLTRPLGRVDIIRCWFVTIRALRKTIFVFKESFRTRKSPVKTGYTKD